MGDLAPIRVPSDMYMTECIISIFIAEFGNICHSTAELKKRENSIMISDDTEIHAHRES